jgi:acetyltransferase-like isoleucine patch superfamily enzyme
MTTGSRLENDWYQSVIPDNVLVDPTAYVETSYSFARFRSELAVGAIIGRCSSVCATILDVGPQGKITIGEYALVSSAYILCDIEVNIGAYSLIAWNAVLMDHYRVRSGYRPSQNTAINMFAGHLSPAQMATFGPISLGRNTWIGLEACILPGISIGEGSIVGARSVVTADVPPFVLVAGNPACVVRQLPRDGAA